MSILTDVAFLIALNVESYTQGREFYYRISCKKLHERKDAHRKPPLPSLPGS
jgi:hypothetical protein